jgi:octaprenyl-diphosphate synthase
VPPATSGDGAPGDFYNRGLTRKRNVPTPFLHEMLARVPEVAEAITADMRAVDAVIVERLRSDVALIDQIGHYIVSAGGKRVRPILLMMTARACGVEGRAPHMLAAVVEFIHTATLLHDDVVDESSLRRGRQTANALFGNAASVLVGDFLYSRSFQMMVEVGNLRVLEVLADATNVIARGEVLQLMNMHDAALKVDDYLRVVRFKTAKLFEASARLGPVLGGQDSAIEAACADYGRALGTAFQLVDDLLDYDGATEDIGKNVGDDLREGKVTLPLLVALERGSESQRAVVREAISAGGTDRLSEVLAIIRATDAIEATRAAARAEADLAIRALEKLDASAFREGLLQFVVRLTDRTR